MQKMKLQHFQSQEEVKTFIETEIVNYLRDELDRMSEKYERDHYTNDDRRVMRRKIHDVEMYLEGAS